MTLKLAQFQSHREIRGYEILVEESADFGKYGEKNMFDLDKYRTHANFTANKLFNYLVN